MRGLGKSGADAYLTSYHEQNTNNSLVPTQMFLLVYSRHVGSLE